MKLNHSRARCIAESLWGTGGTCSYRTSRRGAYYFSCSGHGGYVVDGEALSEEERAVILPYVKPEKAFYAERRGECYFLLNPFVYKSRKYRVYKDTMTGYTDIFLFEEDCDWSVLEKFTGIRAGGRDTPREMINACFNRWCARRVKPTTDPSPPEVAQPS